MDKIRDKIRSSPRWLRYGLVSGAVASIITYIIFMNPDRMGVLFIGTVAPFLFLLFTTIPIELHNIVYKELFMIPTIVVFWTFLGGLLGKYAKNVWIAVLIWLGLQIIGVCVFFRELM